MPVTDFDKVGEQLRLREQRQKIRSQIRKSIRKSHNPKPVKVMYRKDDELRFLDPKGAS